MGLFDATTCRLCATQTDTHLPIFTGEPADTSRQLSSVGLMMRDCLFDEVITCRRYMVETACSLKQAFLDSRSRPLTATRRSSASSVSCS